MTDYGYDDKRMRQHRESLRPRVIQAMLRERTAKGRPHILRRGLPHTRQAEDMALQPRRGDTAL